MTSYNSTNTISISTSSSLHYWLEEYWQEVGDPRVADLPLMTSSGPAITILLLYATFISTVGPKIMSTRKPFSLKIPMISYNLLMSLANGYFFIRILYLHFISPDAPPFNARFPSLEDRSPSAQAIIRLHYLYILSKFVDLLDTIFFVLRKKSNQVTALHCYHHLSVPVQGWTYFRLCGSDHLSATFGLWNSLVHTVMYAWYGLSAIGNSKLLSQLRKVKPYITQLQIVQFLGLTIFAIYFMANNVGYPAYFTFNLLLQSSLYIVLFTRFYLKSYSKNNYLESEEKRIK